VHLKANQLDYKNNVWTKQEKVLQRWKEPGSKLLSRLSQSLPLPACTESRLLVATTDGMKQ